MALTRAGVLGPVAVVLVAAPLALAGTASAAVRPHAPAPVVKPAPTHAATAGDAPAPTPAKDSSEAAGTYSGVAVADAYRLRYAITNFLIIEDFVDGGGPSSQAAIDSLGESTGFASFPYPGQTGATLLGVVSTLTGKPMPSYPFIANSQYPSSPERDISQPGYRLHAESSDIATRSFANGGNQDSAGNEIGGFSRTSVSALKGGGVISRSEATTHLAVSGLKISGVTATSQLVHDPQGKVTKTSSLTVTGMEIGGIPVGVTDRGLVVGSQEVPLGVVGQVAQTVSRQGVTVKYVPAEQTADSVMSAGLEITVEEPVPNTASAKQVVTITLGRTYSQGAATAFAIGLFPIGVGIPGVPGLPGSGTIAPVLPSVPGLPVPVTEAPASLGTVPAPPTVAPGTGETSGPRYLSAAAADLPTLTLFPILALGGLVLLGTTFAVRRQTRASI